MQSPNVARQLTSARSLQGHVRMRLRERLVLSFLMAFLSGPRAVAQAPARPDSFELHGTVRDEASGHPMPGVLIIPDSVAAHRAVTDSSGKYRLIGLPHGSYFISARKFGYYVERREITVACGVVVVDNQGKVVNDGGP